MPQIDPDYCYECQENSGLGVKSNDQIAKDRKKWGKAEVRCRCGGGCCSKHWLNRGELVKVTEPGKCSACDCESYKGTFGGM